MSKRFSKIYVEITNNCNLNCSFCSKDKREKKEMTIEEFEMVINKLKPFTDNVYLHVKGEPLLHSKLNDILSICDKYDINTKITTNGTLLMKKKDILLNHKIKQINVSLHCENKNANYFNNVFNVCDLLSKNCSVVYRIWVLKSLKLDKLSAKIVDRINEYYHLSTELVDKIYKEKNIKIKDNIYVDKEYEFTWPKITDIATDYGTCLGTISHIAILSNGIVTICCLDSEGIINLGNIFEEDLSTILEKDYFQKINNGFKNKKVVCELCKSCTYRHRFNKNNTLL